MNKQINKKLIRITEKLTLSKYYSSIVTSTDGTILEKRKKKKLELHTSLLYLNCYMKASKWNGQEFDLIFPCVKVFNASVYYDWNYLKKP